MFQSKCGKKLKDEEKIHYVTNNSRIDLMKPAILVKPPNSLLPLYDLVQTAVMC